MTIPVLVNLILCCNIGLWLAVFTTFWLSRRAPRLHPSRNGFILSPNGFVFRRPWGECAGLGLLGVVSLLTPLIAATNASGLYGAVRPGDWPAFLVFVAICLTGALLFWWMSQPTELAVDEDRRTYRWIEGWPPFRRTRTGPLSDLAGVGAMIGGGSAYFVYVDGLGRAGKLVVERLSSAEGAEYYADELAALLGVLRLAPGACRWPQLSRQRQRAYAEAASVRPTYRRCRRYLLRF